MEKYTIRYTISLEHEVEIEADNNQEAINKVKSFYDRDIIQDFADHAGDMDFSGADVEFTELFNEEGDIIY